jgi:aminoglycoside phosphotransferase (APT) family kinase protein
MPTPTVALPKDRSELLDEVLSGRGGVEPVRDLALHPERHGVREPDAGPSAGGETHLTLLRTKFKPARKLTAYYRSTGAATAPEHLAVSWQVTPSIGENGLVTVMRYPEDPAMPQLVRLADAEYLAGLVVRMGEPAGVPERLSGVTPIRYRPGQRHVLLASTRQGMPGTIVKIDRHQSGHRAASVASGLAPLLAERCAAVTVAEPMGYSEPDRAALWRVAPGSALSNSLRGQAQGAAGLVALVGSAMRVVHDEAAPALGAVLCEGLPAHDVAAEGAAVRQAGEHLRSLLPAVGQLYDDVAARTLSVLTRTLPARESILHGDLKSDNLLVHGGGVRILDLDRVAVGEASLDLGKFLADLRWWSDARLAGRLQSALREGYGPVAAEVWKRADVLAVLFELKFAARRCLVHDPQWADRVQAQVGLAAAALAEAERA